MLERVYYKIKAMFGSAAVFLAMLLACLVCFVCMRQILELTGESEIVVACVDLDGGGRAAELLEALADTEGFRVVETDAAGAGRLLRRGRAECILTIREGFEEALESNGQPPMTLEMGSASSATQSAMETIGAIVLTAQSRNEALNRLIRDGVLTDSTGSDSFLEAYAEAKEGTVPVLKVRDGPKASAAGGTKVFEDQQSRYTGFTALIVLLCMSSLSSFFADTGRIHTNLRCAAVQGGWLRAQLTDYAALCISGVMLVLLAMIVKGDRSFMEYLAFFGYVVCVGGLCYWYGNTRAAGSVDIAMPVIVIATSAAGGCFYDVSSLGGLFSVLPYFTPQGLLLKAAAGSSLCVLVLFVSGLGLAAAGMFRRNGQG